MTFAERDDGLTSRYARKTPMLAGMLARIAQTFGRAGLPLLRKRVLLTARN